MKSKSCSPLVAAIFAAFLVAPLWAQDQKPSQDSAVDMKAVKEKFQKAFKEAKKDPTVAAAWKSANIMTLNKIAETDPSLAEMAKQEIAKMEKAGTKPADKPAADKKDPNAAPKEGADKPAPTEGKQKKSADKKVPAPDATPGSSPTPKNP